MKKNTKVIVIILVALEIISIYFMYKSSHNKEMKLDNVKLKEDVDYNRFAIYLDGEKYTEESFPTESLLDLEKTKCMNEKGDIIENPKITYTSNSLTIVNTETTYCTLYFNRCTGPTNTVLKGKSDITKCPVGGMYRYQGTDNVNNWICFGTTDKEECTSETGIGKYMYRIIGVTPEGELALIKETGVTGFKWNDKYTTEDCESDGSKCVWPLSKIYNSLNGLCNLNNEHCQEETNIFIGNSYYEYLNEGSIWLNKITNHEWKYGATNGNNGNYDGDSIYIIESQFPNVIPAKIGLQYLHDFYYAYPGGKPKSHDIAKTSWIHLSKDEISGIIDEWLISQSGANSNTISSWAITRYDISNSDLFYSNGVRPVFYLKNDTTFRSGDGSKEDPYIISGMRPS